MAPRALVYRARRKSIGLTALIDVVFILLMFFMLTSSFDRWRAMDFISPVATTSSQHNTPNLIHLHTSGALTLLNSDFPSTHFTDLSTQQLHFFEHSKSTVVLTQADVSLQQIIFTMESLQAIGVASVTLGGVYQLDAPFSQREP